MSVTEAYLAKHRGNKTRAAVDVAVGLNRGDPSTFKQGYSIGSALMAVTDAYNLTAREVALVADALPLAITEHSSPTTRPLGIVVLEGGLVSWQVEKQGIGTPRVLVIDTDQDGSDEAQLRELVAEIERARGLLADYNDPADGDRLYALALWQNEFQDKADGG